ncbi:MAG: PIN/TRAM domain-containing protein [Fimbriimonadaceae bacterium]
MKSAIKKYFGFGRWFIYLCAVLAGTAAAFYAYPSLTWLYDALRESQVREPTDDLVRPGIIAFEMNPLLIVAMAFVGVLIGLLVGILLVRGFQMVVAWWTKLDTGDRVNIFLSFFCGLLAAAPFLILFTATMPNSVVPLAFVGLTVGIGVMCFYVLSSMNEVLPWSQVRRRTRRPGMRILDTSVIIDGRIYEICRSGFLEGTLYVPGFVLAELQNIADDTDALRRQRGRRGLDVLKRLQTDFTVEVRVHDKLVNETGIAVDQRLVRLAEAIGADILTNDYNLNQVAQISKVKVLNINELALAVRSDVLPGEVLELKVIREGREANQGVGYLDDGTMVIIDRGYASIGKVIRLKVTQVIQSDRGRLVFGEPFAPSIEDFIEQTNPEFAENGAPEPPQSPRRSSSKKK